MSRHSKLLRSTAVISTATFGSRILGLFRDSLIGIFLPKTLADAFVTAFRIPSTLRELFAEGALSAAFVPTFTEIHHNEGKEEADQLAQAVFRCLFLILTGICALGILLAPLIIKVLLAGRLGGPDAEIIPYATTLTRIMFPYLLLISMAAVNMGLLHSLKKFGIPACSPIFLNICMISSLLFGAYGKGAKGFTLTIYLACGVLIGGSVQLLSQWALAIKLGYMRKVFGKLWHPKSGEMLKLMLPRVVGVATTQFNMLLNTFFASFLVSGSIFVLWDANRLFQFPLGVMGIALSTATFPQLARDFAEDNMDHFHSTLGSSLSTMITVMIPATVGLILLGYPLAGLLFNYGKFAEHNLLLPTYLALVGYSIGLIGHSGVKLLASAFFALKDTVTPVKVTIASLVLNALVSVIAMQYWGPAGLAFGTSSAALFNLILLSFLLKKKISGEFGEKLFAAFGKVVICSLIMGTVVYATSWLIPFKGNTQVILAQQVFLGLVAGVITYFIALKFFLPQEFMVLKAVVKKK